MTKKSRSGLTSREHQTATLAATGISNRQIANLLGVAEGTVKLHLHSVFDKLGIKSRVALIFHADELRDF